MFRPPYLIGFRRSWTKCSSFAEIASKHLSLHGECAPALPVLELAPEPADRFIRVFVARWIRQSWPTADQCFVADINFGCILERPRRVGRKEISTRSPEGFDHGHHPGPVVAGNRKQIGQTARTSDDAPLGIKLG